jgi:hypothetical protein
MKNSTTESLAQAAKAFLDPGEEGNAAEAVLFFLVDPNPISRLATKNKLILVKAIHDNLSSTEREQFGGRRLTVTQTLESGDYGIDIDDTLPLGDGWQLLVRADGGSGTIYPGEKREIQFDLRRLLDKLESIDFDLDDLCWDDLEKVQPSDDHLDDDDDAVYVTPGEGDAGCGDPSFEIISPEGEEITAAAADLASIRDGNSYCYTVEASISRQGQTLRFKTHFDLSECKSECKGYNLEWSAESAADSEEFAAQVESLLQDGLAILQGKR